MYLLSIESAVPAPAETSLLVNHERIDNKITDPQGHAHGDLGLYRAFTRDGV